MKILSRFVWVLLGGLLSFSVCGAEGYWPQWRGPDGTGAARQSDPPITWDEQTNVRWKTKIPGEGSGSPVVWGDQVFVTTALETDKADDPDVLETAWQRTHNGRTSAVRPSKIVQFVAMAFHREDGRVLWQQVAREELPLEGHHGDGPFASPVVGDDIVFVTSGFREIVMQAIRWEGATGDITDSEAVVWTYNRDTPYVPSPLLHGDRLYFLKNRRGILTYLDAKTGEVVYNQKRLPETREVYASPVGVKDRVYLVGRRGTTSVIRSGDQYEVLATNQLDDRIDGSPAIVGDAIYLRGYRYLYCIAAD